MKNALRSKVSIIDQKHSDKVKVAISSNDMLEKNRAANITVYYCTLNKECPSYSTPCVNGVCPYSTYETVYHSSYNKDKSVEHTLQRMLMHLEEAIKYNEGGEIKKYLDGEEIEEELVIEAIARHGSSYYLNKIDDIPIIDKALRKRRLISEQSKHEEDYTRYSQFDEIGDYLFIKIKSLPSLRNYFWKTVWDGSWIHKDKIDLRFLELIEQHDIVNRRKDLVEEHQKRVAAFKLQLEEKYGLITMLKMEKIAEAH